MECGNEDVRVWECRRIGRKKKNKQRGKKIGLCCGFSWFSKFRVSKFKVLALRLMLKEEIFLDQLQINFKEGFTWKF